MEMKLDAPSSPDGEEEGEGAAAAGPEQAAAQEAAQPLEQAAVLKKGPWTAAEDAVLVEYVRRHGEGNWNGVRRATGLARCGKSCRLRWTNHLRPNLKKGSFTADEELLIARLHAELGNKWARMAAQLPGRTDNEIKNYWNTRLKRRQRAGLPVYPPEVQLHLALTKRCRYELSSSAPSPTSMPPLDAGTASARYTNARPPPLDLTGQFAIANRPLTLIAPLPISAPTSPWAKPFARNALTFQFPHSSPVSPTTPVTPMLPVTPDLSLGYGIRSYDRSSLPPLSPSPGFKLELPSTQLRPAMLSATSASGGGGLQEQPNAARLEAMLQELHDAMDIKASVVAGDHEGRGGSGSGDEDGTVVERDSGSGDKTKAESKERSRPMHENDIGTLFDLIPTSPLAEPAPAALKLSCLEHGNGDRDRSSLDLRTDLQLIGGISSTDQEWSLDGFC